MALQYPQSGFNNGPLLIYLTARDQGRGEAALKQIHEDAQLKQAKALVSQGGLSTIKYKQLDISDKQSIDKLADDLKTEHGQIDVLINNAGIAMRELLPFGRLHELILAFRGIRCQHRQRDSSLQLLVCSCLASIVFESDPIRSGTLEATERILPLIRDGGRLVNVASSEHFCRSD